MERLRSHAGASCSSRQVDRILSARSTLLQSGCWRKINTAFGRRAPACASLRGDSDRASSTTTATPPGSSGSAAEHQHGVPETPTSEQESKGSESVQSQSEEPSVLPLEEDGPKMPSSPLVAAIGLLGVAFLLGGGYVFKDQIGAFLEFFIAAVDDWGPWGYAAYALVYIGLEVLALPAIPLTMTAGAIFGTNQGTALVSLAGTAAATIAFLIARYAARDKVRKFAYKLPNFKAIDRAIGRSGLKFVTLVRLSPLLPLAASNYLYGLTSVDLGSYVLGSWIGMLPGTYAYVHAGAIGRAVLSGEGQSMNVETWQVALGLGATVLALGFIGRLAKAAIEEEEAEVLDPSSGAPPAPPPGPPQ